MIGLRKLRSRLRRLAWRRWFLLGALFLALALAGYKAERVWKLAQSLQGRLDRLQAAADGTADIGLRELGADLRGTHADLNALQREIGFLLPLMRRLGWVPGIGGDLQAAPPLLYMALSVTEAGTLAFDSLEPLIALTEDGSTDGRTLAHAVEILSDARADLEGAQIPLTRAAERRAEIDAATLSARTARWVARLDRYLPLLQAALDGGRVLPDLLGASGRRSYLVLAQNNDELRGSGGFISAAGRLTLENGEIAELVFEDAYAVDDFGRPYPDPPPPLLRYMGTDLWVFRDANWSPDHPTSAQKALELYRISRELQADGVLSVDQHTLQALAAAMAPLEVEGWPEPVTGENVISLIRLAWAPDEVESSGRFDARWWGQRKRFINDLVGAMRARLETAPEQVDWLALARAVLKVLDERHLQIWLADSSSAAARLLGYQGWDGALRRATSDYLLVVDSNLGYNKANAIIQENLDYRVLVSADRRAQATLTVRHVNPADGEENCDHRPRYGADYTDLINRCYWDYLRVYVPAGSQLAAATAHPIAADLLITRQRQSGLAEVLPEEHGKAVYGTFSVVPCGQETITRFVYQLPQATLARGDGGWWYRLLAQKQAGASAVPLRVTLALPPGAKAQSLHVSDLSDASRGSTAFDQPEPGVVILDMTLDRDQFIEVFFYLDER